MKNGLITLVLSLLCLTVFSQDLNFVLRGTYSKPVTKKRLNAATTMSEINDGYPASWVSDYVSTEISATSSGKQLTAKGNAESLTPEQKKVLKAASTGTNVTVTVNYRCKNSATGAAEVRIMRYSLNVIPEVEAVFPGGEEKMTEYLKSNAINKLKPESAPIFTAKVKFTVNENGEIANARLAEVSHDPNIDQLLLKTITAMPKWKPAQSAQGINVEQEFEFIVTTDPGGC